MSRKNQTDQVNKAQVTLTPPGNQTLRFAIVRGGQRQKDSLPSLSKRKQYDIYYEMYRQHPTLHAGINKIAKYAVANGFGFRPAIPGGKVGDRKLREVRAFFRRSKGNQLLRRTFKDIEIYGEGLWLVILTASGRPFKAVRLHPKYADPIAEGGIITSLRYGPVMSESATEYPYAQILHFQHEDPDTDTQGLSPLHPLQRTVAQDIFAMDFNESFFKNAAQTGIIFNMRNSSQEEAERNRQYLEENYVGTENAHKPLILEGDIDVKRAVAKPQEMEFIEGRKFLRQEVLTVLDLDPSKVGITEDANRSTSKEADRAFQYDTIRPLQNIIEDEINDKLILDLFGWDDLLFHFHEADPRSLMEMAEVYDSLWRMGALNTNEIRAELGRTAVEGGDRHMIQTAQGVIPIDRIDEVAHVLETRNRGTGNEPPRPTTSDDDPERIHEEDE